MSSHKAKSLTLVQKLRLSASNPKPIKPALTYFLCLMLFWTYSVKIAMNETENVFFCFDDVMPSGTLRNDANVKVHNCGWFASVYFDLPLEFRDHQYLTSSHNVTSSHAFAQGLAKSRQMLQKLLTLRHQGGRCWFSCLTSVRWHLMMILSWSRWWIGTWMWTLLLLIVRFVPRQSSTGFCLRK